MVLVLLQHPTDIFLLSLVAKARSFLLVKHYVHGVQWEGHKV